KSMGRRFEGRTAIVTGAARGIGRATADRFAEAGARVVVADLDGGAAEEAAAGIAKAHGGEALGIACDVGEKDSAEAIPSASPPCAFAMP
ncbi:SDR family NAD(P)-dependent oxidoreductase, partial [Oceanibium sediminis]|uniref:SDR family NAD(P)-dependent oxidoreductase n=1 Tax=Oceanibium sediminis TaxID=2026339 RepID=UPI0018E4F69A